MSKYRITLEGKTYEMEIELVPENGKEKPSMTQAKQEMKTAVKASDAGAVSAAEKKNPVNVPGAVAAPMPGTVIKIVKAEGDAVKTGDLVMILEAMKMENEILAPSDGIISHIFCKVGGTVAGGESLFEVK